nr:mGST1 protein [Diaphanosoma celebensis]
MAESLYTLSNPVFAAYCFYGALLCLKTLLMAPLTGRLRIIKKAFANPEDGKVKTDDDVERVRRAHLNDLENILPFLVLGFLYVATNPSPTTALLAFRVFALARFIYTLVYAVFVLRQPARGIAFMTGMVVNVYLAISVIMTCW